MKTNNITDQYIIQAGNNFSLGAKVDGDGVNFCIFSRHATDVQLRLYKRADDDIPFQVAQLDPNIHRTFFFWHVYLEKLQAGCYYTWLVDGPDDTQHTGFRFNKKIELLDPWARAVVDDRWDRHQTVNNNGDNFTTSMRGLVVNNEYDWEGDTPINHPLEDSIIYELHVGGFTRHASANVKHPGTFSAIIEKIPYLQSLGVTDIELMPVMAFDEQDVPAGVAARGLNNYWGYSTHSFFSPHPHYCVNPYIANHLTEFRDMVKALHRAGIGVILDVVFNHTAEGGAEGPTINFKGLFNELMYHLDPIDRQQYRDYTGCGNTVNCNHPLITRFIINCLVFWVTEMHVDGFRFDLASVFSRGENGEPMYNAPLPWSIEFSRFLSRTKIIAEAWDAAGLYQLGTFPGFRWSEWNGRYRDVIRKFIRGDQGLVSEVATCIAGSSDIYQPQSRLPVNSINFVTCHDGFTLHDLVSYNHKHNTENGEDNHDGHNDNCSWNCGTEGLTNDLEIQKLRKQQIKNFASILLISQGVPMILAGDEIMRTQKGNNNAYCQDNELNWFDWRQVDSHQDMFRFFQQMIAFRKRHRCLRAKRYLTGKPSNGSPLPDISWHGIQPDQPLWMDGEAQILGFTLAAVATDEEHVHVIINMSADRQEIALPHMINHHWYRAVDTSLASPDDILTPTNQPRLSSEIYTTRARSVVILEARLTHHPEVKE